MLTTTTITILLLVLPSQTPQSYPSRQPDQNRYNSGQDYNNRYGSNWNQTRPQNGLYDLNPYSGNQSNYFSANNNHATPNHTYYGNANQTQQHQPPAYPQYMNRGD